MVEKSPFKTSIAIVARLRVAVVGGLTACNVYQNNANYLRVKNMSEICCQVMSPFDFSLHFAYLFDIAVLCMKMKKQK